MKYLLLICLVLTLSFSQFSFAYYQGSGVGQGNGNSKNKTQMKINSSQQAAQIAISRFGGKVLKVSKKNIKSAPAYRVKLVKSNGHVISVLVDAKTGKIRGN